MESVGSLHNHEAREPRRPRRLFGETLALDTPRAHDFGVERSAARLQFGPVTLIPAERVLLQDGQPVSLTPKAFELLAFLAANPGRLLTKDELLQAVWPDAVVEESNLAYTVFAIRKALGEGPESARYIETVPIARSAPWRQFSAWLAG